MRYTLIELRKQPGYWSLSILPKETDHVAEETKPHPLGFYHAPRRHSAKRSFNRLKDSLVEDRRCLIAKLQQEIDELESMELPPKTPARPVDGVYHQFKTRKRRRRKAS